MVTFQYQGCTDTPCYLWIQSYLVSVYWKIISKLVSMLQLLKQRRFRYGYYCSLYILTWENHLSMSISREFISTFECHLLFPEIAKPKVIFARMNSQLLRSLFHHSDVLMQDWLCPVARKL